MTTKKTHDPIPPKGYAALRRYVEEATAHELDPLHNPPPCQDLFLVKPIHGPITAVELATIDKEPQVCVSFHGRNLRYFDSLDYAALALGLAFGMGISVQDNGKGQGYPRLRVSRPNGRLIYVLRILTSAKPGEVARQAQGVDYHHLARRHLYVEPVEETRSEDKASRPPLLGRGAFLRAAERYWTLHSEAAGIEVLLVDHLRLIRTALEIGDRREAGRRHAATGPGKAD